MTDRKRTEATNEELGRDFAETAFDEKDVAAGTDAAHVDGLETCEHS